MVPKNVDLMAGNKGTSADIFTAKENETTVTKLNNEVKVDTDDGKIDLEDALDDIGLGRYNYVVLLVSCYSLLSASTEAFGIGVIVTSAQCELHLDTYRKGIIGAVPMLGIIVSSHAWGYIADTRGRRYAMLIALSGTWILGILSSFVTHWIALAILKFLSVIFASGANAVVYAFLVEMTPRLHRNRFMMLSTTSLMLSQCLIASLGYLVLRHDFSIPLVGSLVYSPWRLMCQVFALVNFVAMLMFITLVYESPKFYLSQGRETESLKVLSRIYAVNTGNKPENYSVKSITMHEDTNKDLEATLLRSMWNQTAPLFRRKYIKNTLVIMYIAAVAFSTLFMGVDQKCTALGFISQRLLAIFTKKTYLLIIFFQILNNNEILGGPPVVIWLPHVGNAFLRASPDNVVEDTFCGRVVSQLKISNNASAILGICNDKVDDFVLYMMMMISGIVTSVGIVSVILVRLFGKKAVVIILNLIVTAGCLILNNVYGYSSMVVFLTLGSNSIVMGIVSAFAVEVYPTYLRSMAVCLTMMAGRGFSFIVINIMGPQIENNCNYFFYGFGAFIFSAVVVGFFLPGEQKKHPTKFTSHESK